ncbi:hypothetical protein [Arcicella lustrica]|uniref:Uncharacterized protein n=1 Tax=Arcicella lustrica TaxID=2984196 RepID=A0ABU5SEB2_9BACT|nr:hypothetical protein [Arcicella sp. DC25W]MEA5425606.1 hypothetical protein [Arcicella sp. DC25W]
MKRNIFFMSIGVLLLSLSQIYSQTASKGVIWLPQNYLDSMNVCETEKEAYNRFLNPVQALLLEKGKYKILLFEQEYFPIPLKRVSKNQYLITDTNVNVDMTLGFDEKLKDKKTELIFNSDTSIDILFYDKAQVTRKVHMVKYHRLIHQYDPLAIFYERKLKGKYTLLDANHKKIDSWAIGDNFTLKSTLFENLKLIHLPGGCNSCIALPIFRLITKKGIVEEVKLAYSKDAIYCYMEKNRNRTLRYILTKLL